ncbi:PHD finger protein ALFIN-LIKE 4-like isoform X1 [Carex rostrata]
MDGGAYNPRTVEEVFRDFKGRRAGIIRALTTDVEEFYRACDPEKDNLSLYGFPTEQWEVNLPAEEVPPELPEPALGINFARDGMQEKDWLGMVAVHSDVWLISVAYFFGARFGFDRTDRKRLFNMINELPTIFEIVSGKAGVKSQPTNNSNSKSKSNSKPKVHNSHPRPAKAPKKLTKKEEEEDEDQGGLDEERGVGLDEEQGVEEEEEEDDDDDEEEEEEEHGDTLCGACGEHYASDEFWICCDICEKWFHGKCVKVTPARAEHIKQYKCPTCSTNKRARPS